MIKKVLFNRLNNKILQFKDINNRINALTIKFIF